MSLQIKISAKEDKDIIVVYDCTGKYSYDNKYGWGKPNYELKIVASAQLEVYPPEVVTPILVTVFPDFPTDDTDLGYELTADLFSMQKIESGVWKIGMRVKGKDSKGANFEVYNENKFIFTEVAECCVDKLRSITANVPVTVFTKDDKRKKASELSTLLEDALWAKKCGKYDVAQKILKFINLQCQCCK